MLSRELEETLRRAMGNATARMHEFATLEHLLLGLTEDSDALEVLVACKVDIEELQDDIKRIGLFRNKSKSIQKCCHALIEKHGGNVPADMKSLVALAGVGRKTANVVLGNAFNINEGVVVDTHVARLSNRLGLTLEKSPEKIEVNLQKLVPRNDWTMFSHWLIWHGRRRCSARKPDCSICEISMLCPSGKNGIYQ